MSKRALVIGVADLRPNCSVDPSPTVQVITGLLEELGGWSIQVVEGLEATRDRILDALANLAEQVEPGDAVLLHFFGHGGVVRFTDGPGELGERPVFYLSAARHGDEAEMTGVLDLEVSAVLHRIEAVCRNLSVILDCCHSAAVVRGRIHDCPAPAWVHELPRRSEGKGPGWSDGHPGIVRIAGTSSLHFGFAHHTPSGHLGLLTEGFAKVVREAGLALDRLTWDAVAHRVREYAIETRGYEEQWVTLAGPRSRLLFSRETVELPRSVGFVSGTEPDRGWLRAGLLQGVELGDEWGIAGLTLDPDGRPRMLASARVVATELNRAQVELEPSAEEDGSLPDGSSALLLRAANRLPVRVEGQAEVLRRALEASAVLRPAEANESAFARVSVDHTGSGSTFQLHRTSDELTLLPLKQDAQALVWLEDWGRSQHLLRAVETAPSALRPLPLHVAWGRCDDDRDRLLPPTGAQLFPGQRVFFEFAHAGQTPEPWYVCIVEFDAAGRPNLLNTSEPDGVEVEPRQTIYLGRRYARHREGMTLRWSELVSRERPRPVAVLILMSLRPMVLGHLVRTPELAVRDELWRWNSGLRGEQAPALSTKWAWTMLRYTLAPAS